MSRPYMTDGAMRGKIRWFHRSLRARITLARIRLSRAELGSSRWHSTAGCDTIPRSPVTCFENLGPLKATGLTYAIDVL